MKKIFLIGVMLFANDLYAHDEGHGPKLSDVGRYGGLVSSIILKSDMEKTNEAKLLYKAELVRSSDKTIRVYVYDRKMNLLDLKGFDAKGKATLSARVKKKYKNADFNLSIKDKAFVGKMPEPKGLPYNIEVVLKKNNKELFAAFENLD